MTDKVGRRQKLKNKIKGVFAKLSRPGSKQNSRCGPANQSELADNAVEVLTDNKTIEGKRSDWETIRAIPDHIFCQLVLNGTDLGRKVTLNNVTITYKTSGSYHEVVMLQLCRNGLLEDYVIRVPAHGTPKLWTDQDDYMMQREVELMIYLHLNTNVPVPEVIDFSTAIHKGIGFPYILMRRLPGNTAYDIWFDDIDNYNPRKAFQNADCPSEETEKKRGTFLRSLAGIMTELGQLKFDQIGVPIFDLGRSPKPPTVGPSYHWISRDKGHAVVKRPTYQTTKHYIDSVLITTWNHAAQRGDNWQDDDSWRNDNVFCMYRGIRKILDMVFASSAFNQQDENFTICHPDVDLQNILTDEDGNITGILDWDGAFVAPCCIGAAAFPKFLNRDWFPSSVGGLFSAPHMGWRMDYYRGIYTAAMVQHGNPDTYLTSNSAMYAAVMGGLLGICGGGDVFHFTEKLLRMIPKLFVDHIEFLVGLGIGWPAAEAMLKEEIAKLLEPKLPSNDPLQLLQSSTEDLLIPCTTNKKGQEETQAIDRSPRERGKQLTNTIEDAF